MNDTLRVGGIENVEQLVRDRECDRQRQLVVELRLERLDVHTFQELHDEEGQSSSATSSSRTATAPACRSEFAA